MNKKIENVYDFLDYRILLNADFLERSNSNHSYSLRAYSRDLDVSPGFLSDVLRGKKALSVAKGREVFRKIGLLEDEIIYVESLITLKSSDDENLRADAQKFIQQRYNKAKFVPNSTRDLYIKTLAHFMVYGLIRKIDRLETVIRMAAKLGIESNEVVGIFEEFKQEGYVRETDGLLVAVDEKIVIREHARIVPIMTDFATHLGRLIEANGGMIAPDQTAHSFIIGLDQTSFEMAVEAQKHFIQTLHRLSQKNEKADRFLFYAELFLKIEVQDNPGTVAQTQ
jgi:hypothetical protein